MGEDIAQLGGIFQCTKGLYEARYLVITPSSSALRGCTRSSEGSN